MKQLSTRIESKKNVASRYLARLLPVLMIAVLHAPLSISLATESQEKPDGVVATGQSEIDLVKEQLQTILNEQQHEQSADLGSRINKATQLIGEGKFEEANRFLEESRKIFPDEPELLVRHAEVLSRLNEHSLAGKPYELLGKSLDINRRHKQSLWMMALANKQAGNHEATYILLNLLKLEMPADSSSSHPANDIVTSMIAETAVRLQDAGIQLPLGPRPVSSKSTKTDAETISKEQQKSESPSIAVYITLTQQIIDEFSPDDTVFIYARADEGSRMPLAVTRLRVRDFPATVVLDDTMAMMPSRSLGTADIVTVGARVSKTGTAMPFAGDWEKEVRSVPVDTTEVISIDIDFLLQ